MVQEILTYGQLQNSDLIRGVMAADCYYLHSSTNDTDFIQQHVNATVLENVIKASIVVTSENYVPYDPEIRPPGWQYVKTTRVRFKSDVTNISDSQHYSMYNQVKRC